MNSTALLMAQLAEAAYANLSVPDKDGCEAALKELLASESEATALVSRFEMTQRSHAGSGLSATVFRDLETNEVTLSIRGTDGPVDYLVDGLLVLGAAAELNVQFMVLQGWIEAWSQPTVNS